MGEIVKQSKEELYQNARVLFSTGGMLYIHDKMWTIDEMRGDGNKQLLTLCDIESGDKREFNLEDLNPIILPEDNNKEQEKQVEMEERIADMVVDKIEERVIKGRVLREVITDIVSDIYVKVKV